MWLSSSASIQFPRKCSPLIKKAGVPLIGYGQFLTQVVDFLIVAFIIFLILRAVSRAIAVMEKEKEQGTAAPEAEAAEVVLLREIRDELKARRGA